MSLNCFLFRRLRSVSSSASEQCEYGKRGKWINHACLLHVGGGSEGASLSGPFSLNRELANLGRRGTFDSPIQLGAGSITSWLGRRQHCPAGGRGRLIVGAWARRQQDWELSKTGAHPRKGLSFVSLTETSCSCFMSWGDFVWLRSTLACCFVSEVRFGSWFLGLEFGR